MMDNTSKIQDLEFEEPKMASEMGNTAQRDKLVITKLDH